MHLPINGNGETARLWGSQPLTDLVRQAYADAGVEADVLDFIDDNMALPDSIKPKKRRIRGGEAADCGVTDGVLDSSKLPV